MCGVPFTDIFPHHGGVQQAIDAHDGSLATWSNTIGYQ